MIDMHLHTKWSDGSLSVLELVERLRKSNINYAVLTDHDCILGNKEFKEECHKNNIKTISGTELEAYYDVKNSIYLHMLCYDYKDSKKLNNFLEELRQKRINSINTAIEILNKKGYDLSFNDVTNILIGRHLLINHLCILLEKEKIVNSRFQAYNMMLNDWNLNYPKPTVEEIIKLIYDVGGIPVLAHPKRIKMNFTEKEEYVKYLKKIGLIGIESYYSFDNLNERKESIYLAEKYNLIETVGSDWHCDEDGISFGNSNISQEKELILRRKFFHE